MTFTLDLKRFAEKAGKRADLVVGGVVVALHGKIDERSPVGDPKLWVYNRGSKESPDYVNYLAYRDTDGYVGGRFRANWQLGIGSAPEGVLDRVDPDGGTVRAEISAAIPAKAAGNVFWLANNLPYAERLENGWSTQAPTGMVSLTVREFQSVVAAQLAKAKGATP